MNKKIILIFVILQIITSYILYQQNLELEHLHSKFKIANIATQFMAIIKTENPNKEFRIGCNIYVQHKFGQWNKWIIATDGLHYNFEGTNVILTNSKKTS